jgi:hypothetical protein
MVSRRKRFNHARVRSTTRAVPAQPNDLHPFLGWLSYLCPGGAVPAGRSRVARHFRAGGEFKEKCVPEERWEGARPTNKRRPSFPGRTRRRKSERAPPARRDACPAPLRAGGPSLEGRSFCFEMLPRHGSAGLLSIVPPGLPLRGKDSSTNSQTGVSERLQLLLLSTAGVCAGAAYGYKPEKHP